MPKHRNKITLNDKKKFVDDNYQGLRLKIGLASHLRFKGFLVFRGFHLQVKHYLLLVLKLHVLLFVILLKITLH
jgi:hypothetical protein